MRWLLGLCLGLIVGCSGAPGPAGEDLSAEVTYFADKSGTISAEDIARYLPQFEKAPSAPPELPGGSTAYWFHLTLSRERLSPRAVLGLDTESLSSIELYRRGHEVQRAGYATPLHQRRVRQANNMFTVGFDDSEEEAELFFKVWAPIRLRFPLVGWSQPEFLSASIARYFELGLFFGAMLIMACYNLFLAYALRKRAYAYYALYTLSLALYVALVERLLLHLVSGAITPWGVTAIVGLMPPTGLLFTRAFLDVPRFAPRLDRALLAQVALAVPVMSVGLFDNSIWRERAVDLAVLAAVVTWIAAVVIALRAGHRTARYMAAALGLTLAIAVLTSLIGTRVLPDFQGRLSLFRFSLVLEQLILSLGLADLYREVQRARQRERLAYVEEREQLQREVHDTVASDVQAALMALPGGTDPRPMLERALTGARDLAALLRMSRQTEQTLEQAVDAYIKNLRMQPGCSVDYRFDPALNEAPASVRLQLYRIFQEWMSNCLRHAQANRFRIELLRRPGANGAMAVLRIHSNGAAFTWSSKQAAATMGSGLSNMHYRCEKIAGRARACAGRDCGSRFVLRAPI